MNFFIPIFASLCLYNYTTCAYVSKQILSNFITYPAHCELLFGQDGAIMSDEQYVFCKEFSTALKEYPTKQQRVFSIACIHALPISTRYAVHAGASPNTSFRFRSKQNKSYTVVTPLLLAIQLHPLSYVKELIDLGANIHSDCGNGQTALHVACVKNDAELVQFLLHKGADTTLKNGAGKTPLEVTTSTKIRNLFAPYIPNWGDTLD